MEILILFVLAIIIHQNQKHKMTQDELVEKVQSLSAVVAKIGTESSKSLELIQTLKDELAKEPTVKPALAQAVSDLEAQLTVVDNIVPDAPVETPTEPTAPPAE